jgi:hypothetical protein
VKWKVFSLFDVQDYGSILFFKKLLDDITTKEGSNIDGQNFTIMKVLFFLWYNLQFNKKDDQGDNYFNNCFLKHLFYFPKVLLHVFRL